jgi:large conductance mechanosensitive channel
MKKFIEEFKEFISKGNVMDMAIGVIIGGAFGKIVSSLVEDVIMPAIGMLIGNIDFSNIFISLGENDYRTYAEAKEAGAAIGIGVFINNVVNFLIIALVIFIVIKQINAMKDKFHTKEEEEEIATTKVCPFCKSEINIEATRCPNCTSQLEK